MSTQEEIIELAKEIAAQYIKAERYQTWTYDYVMQRLMELADLSASVERARIKEEQQRCYVARGAQ